MSFKKAHRGLSSDVTHMGLWTTERIFCLLKIAEISAKYLFKAVRDLGDQIYKDILFWSSSEHWYLLKRVLTAVY